jgi:hypothetical protein
MAIKSNGAGLVTDESVAAGGGGKGDILDILLYEQNSRMSPLIPWSSIRITGDAGGLNIRLTCRVCLSLMLASEKARANPVHSIDKMK